MSQAVPASLGRFKLHLRSRYGNGVTLNDNVAPLPPNKTIVDVLADFLGYMLKCAMSFIQECHPGGTLIWESLKDNTYFVLSHPNGWGGKEQNQMRQATIQATLIPDTGPGHDRLSFVTEGEANLHYAIENGILKDTKMVFKTFLYVQTVTNCSCFCEESRSHYCRRRGRHYRCQRLQAYL